MNLRKFALFLILFFYFSHESLAQNLQDAIREAGTTHLLSRRVLLQDWPHSTWWTQSHNIDGLLHYDPDNYRRLNQVFFWLSFRPYHDYQNNIYDDEGWWALAWLNAYTSSQNTEEKFLNRTLALYRHIQSRGWSDLCGGSYFFKDGDHYQNAVTNGIFTVLSLRLFELTGEIAYWDAAQRVLQWFDQSGLMNNPEALVNDGLTADCVPKGSFWSYNQGLYIEAFSRTGQIDRAWKLFQASKLYFMNSKGAFAEKNCESEQTKNPCGVDGITFKGIYMKSLRELGKALSAQGDFDRLNELRAFADQQAALVMKTKKNKKGWYPLRWADDQPGQFTPVTHVVALETLLLSDYLHQL